MLMCYISINSVHLTAGPRPPTIIRTDQLDFLVEPELFVSRTFVRRRGGEVTLGLTAVATCLDSSASVSILQLHSLQLEIEAINIV